MLQEEQHRKLLRYKQKILSKITFILFLLIMPMAIFRFYEGNYLQSASDMILGIFLIYTSKRATRSTKEVFYPLARKVFFVAFITLFILMVHTHETISLFAWISTAIYLIFYVFDAKEGWRWFSVIATIIAVLFLYDDTLLGLSGYELLVLLFNMISVLYIITWYERIKEESSEAFIRQQRFLKQKVEEKTLALKQLNASLEERVQQEVESNRLKEGQLIQQSRLAQMGEIISMIAHQWRQPLSAISTSSILLELKSRWGDVDADLVRKKSQEISSLAQHLSKTIDDFRDFFKPNKEKEVSDYNSILISVRNMIEPALAYKEIALCYELHAKQHFRTYTSKLKQVVLNLIKNAEDALLENNIPDPTITVRTYDEEDRIILEVSDNAGGIPEEIMDKIFDPYFSTKGEKNGTGLGLYMSKVIVEKHCGGILSVENTQEGAVFRIVLYRDGDASSEL